MTGNHRWRNVLLLAFLMVILAGIALCVVSAARIDRRIPGVTILPLPLRCELEFYGQTAQPVFTVAAACPGIDSIRLWPMPIQFPWFEKPILPPGGQQADIYGRSTAGKGQVRESAARITYQVQLSRSTASQCRAGKFVQIGSLAVGRLRSW